MSFTRGQTLHADDLNNAFVDRVARAGDQMSGPLLLLRDPQSNFEAATKQYADSRTAGVPVLTSNAVGVLIPGYIYPNNPYSDPTMQAFIQLVRNNHDVPVLYVINPSNGPGIVTDGNYAALIRLLRASGVHVLGYVSTQYAARDPNGVKFDVVNWVTLYGQLDGIFYDEMPYDPGTNNASVTLYQQYYAHAKQNGYQIVVANPGTNQQGVWYGASPPTADIIVTWENSTYPIESDLQGNFVGGHGDYSYKRNSVLVYAQSFDPVAFAMMKKYAKYIWVTDDVLANQWDAFPTYMSTIFAACKPTSSAVNKLTSIIAPVSIPADTNEDTLHTYTLPANSLAVNGQSVRVTMWGTYANNAHNKTVRAYFGATAFAFPATALAVANHTWTVDLVVTRLTATTQAAKARYQDTSGVSEVVAVNLVASPAETLSGNIVIRNTGQITATPTSGDIIATATVVELMP